MARIPLEICDVLGISLVLERAGWSGLFIHHESGTLECRISAAFSNVAAELLQLCRGILKNEIVSIALFDEPGGYLISLTPDARQQHTMALVVRALDACVDVSGITGSEATVLSMRVKRRHLLGSLMVELWKTHHFLSEPSFQKGRMSDFPADDLMACNREWDAHERLGPSFLK